MNTWRMVLAVAAVVAAAAAGPGCRHFGFVDEPDAGPGPFCNPCDQYRVRVNACVASACKEKGCLNCESVFHLVQPTCAAGKDGGSAGLLDGALEINTGAGGDAGTCSGDERGSAYERLAQFTCDGDPQVAMYVEQLDAVCVTCTSAGEMCAQGYCYYTGQYGNYACMSPGGASVGDACSDAASCAQGAQCLSFEGTARCFRVCYSGDYCGPSQECTDTGFGFMVCVTIE